MNKLPVGTIVRIRGTELIGLVIGRRHILHGKVRSLHPTYTVSIYNGRMRVQADHADVEAA